MEILYLLIPIALVFVVLAIRLFFWAVRSGQYDDLDTEGKRILFDDPPAKGSALDNPPSDRPESDRLEPREPSRNPRDASDSRET